MDDILDHNQNYDPKLEDYEATQYRQKYPAQSVSVINGAAPSVIVINHDTNVFLDPANSWLNFRVQALGLTGTNMAANSTAAGFTLAQQGASACIDRLVVKQGSSIIYDMNEYATIAAVLRASNTGFMNNESISCTSGTAASFIDTLGVNNSQVVNGSNPVQSFSLQLLGLLGGSASKCIPLALLSSPLQVYIYWKQSVTDVFFCKSGNAAGTITGGNLYIDKVEYDASNIRVSDNSYRSILEASGNSGGNNIMSWSGIDYSASQNTVSVAEQNAVSLTPNVQLMANNRFASLLANIVTCKQTNNGNVDPSNLIYPFQSLQYIIDGQRYPPTKLKTTAEICSSMLTVTHQQAPTVNNNLFTSSLYSLGFTQPSATAINYPRMTVAGYAYNAFDTNEDGAGIDTSNSVCQFEGDLKNAVGSATLAATAIHISKYNCLWSISPSGVMYRSF